MAVTCWCMKARNNITLSLDMMTLSEAWLMFFPLDYLPKTFEQLPDHNCQQFCTNRSNWRLSHSWSGSSMSFSKWALWCLVSDMLLQLLKTTSMFGLFWRDGEEMNGSKCKWQVLHKVWNCYQQAVILGVSRKGWIWGVMQLPFQCAEDDNASKRRRCFGRMHEEYNSSMSYLNHWNTMVVICEHGAAFADYVSVQKNHSVPLKSSNVTCNLELQVTQF